MLSVVQSENFEVYAQMANMLEGGGRTPVLSPEELEQMGFKLVAYPLSLLGVSIRAMQSALQLLKVRSSLRTRPHLHRPRNGERRDGSAHVFLPYTRGVHGLLCVHHAPVLAGVVLWDPHVRPQKLSIDNTGTHQRVTASLCLPCRQPFVGQGSLDGSLK